jgi:hypothetical protein
MAFKSDDGMIGTPAFEAVIPVPTSLAALPWSPGFMLPAEDPVWGPAELVFGRAGGTIPLGALCVLTSVWDVTNKVYTYNFVVAPNTANQGRPVYVFIGNTQATVGQYAWFLVAGRFPVASGATVAADAAVGITAAGIVGAFAAGKQVVNARVATPATQTVVAASVLGNAGSNQIFLASTQGFFPGVYVSGTGVGASAICSFVDPLGAYILVTVVNSAAVTGNVTATYNNATIFYNVLETDRAFAQGAIT